MKKVLIFISLIIIIILFYLYPKFSNKDEKQKISPDYNIILISIDTLRADRLGVYGYKKPITPNLDALAAKSTVFSKAYSQSSWTLPAHASMLTGSYPHEIGVEYINDRLPEKTETIAQILKNAGYKTFAFTSGVFINRDRGFAKGFDKFEENSDWQDAQIITQKAIKNIPTSQEKFFMFLHYFHVHDPYAPQADSLEELHQPEPHAVCVARVLSHPVLKLKTDRMIARNHTTLAKVRQNAEDACP